MKNIVAIIPARGGSVGIPDKNVIGFCGHPLLAWSILHAQQAMSVTSVWVTSDSNKILDVANAYGASTIKRPADIATDIASSESAWLHAIKFIESQGQAIDLVLGMQATSPLRQAIDVDQAIKKFYDGSYDSLFSSAELEDFFIWKRNSGGELESFNYDYLNRKCRQELSAQYVENGSFYLFKPELLRQCNNRLGGKIGTFTMDFWKTFEIDNQADYRLCEMLMRLYLLQEQTEAIDDLRKKQCLV